MRTWRVFAFPEAVARADARDIGDGGGVGLMPGCVADRELGTP